MKVNLGLKHYYFFEINFLPPRSTRSRDSSADHSPSSSALSTLLLYFPPALPPPPPPDAGTSSPEIIGFFGFITSREIFKGFRDFFILVKFCDF